MTNRQHGRRQYDVLLAGYFGFGNLGDELLAQVAVDFLTQNDVPKERIAILSADAQRSRKTLGIDAYGRWKIGTLRNAFSRTHSLLLAGGGLFQDSTSIRSCLYYWGLVKMARWCGCRAWALGQSIGPLRRAVSRRFARSAFSQCAYLAVRDRPSLAWAQKAGIQASLMPDPVLGLPLSRPADSARTVVAINMRPTDLSAPSAHAVLQAAETVRARGMPMRGIALSASDEETMALRMSRGELPSFDIVRVDSAETFAETMGDVCAAAGMRLHFGILCSLLDVPLALSPYDPKVAAFSAEQNIPTLPVNGETWNRLLTNAPFRDKSSLMLSRDLISKHFADGLQAILGAM